MFPIVVDFRARSPRMRRGSWMSLGIIVTRLVWTAHELVSSKKANQTGLACPCKAPVTALWKRTSGLSLEQVLAPDPGREVCKSGVQWTSDNISFHGVPRAVPGLSPCGFLTPPAEGALWRAALVASCFLGP